MPYGKLALDTIETSGNLAVAGNTAVTGNLTVSGISTANTYNLVSQTLGTATPGKFEYDGQVPYFTPAGTQRGVVPGMQYYVTNAQVVGANSTGAQSILGVGVTLSSSTFYAFEGVFNFFKLAGTTSHTFSFGWGGTATLERIVTNIIKYDGANGYVTLSRAATTYTLETANATVITGAITSAFYTVNLNIKGIIKVTTGGTLIPQYTLSAAPGGAYTGSTSNYLSIWPIGPATGNVSVGSWA